MKLDAHTLDYLNGKKFASSLAMPIPYREDIPKRVAFLKEFLKDKKVIHLGCLDHLPLIDSKIAGGQWLHKELTAVASKCIGIDIDQEAFQHVSSKHGFNNILLGDFTTQKFPEIASESWDYAVLGELLEHIDNPVSFLSSIQKNYSGSLGRIIITVPNAWTQNTMRKATRSIEVINTDHRYWFTPYTISKVIIQAGMTVEDIYFANRIPLTTTQLIIRKLLSFVGIKKKYNFTYASSIVAIARL
jgi:hypothetical protein